MIVRRKGLKAKRCLQFHQVLAPRLFPLPVCFPAIWGCSELIGSQFQQGRKWRFVNAQNDSGKTQVAELHGEAETVRMSAPLIDDGKVGFAERIVPDQLIICVRQRKQTFPLGGGQDRTAWHPCSSCKRRITRRQPSPHSGNVESDTYASRNYFLKYTSQTATMAMSFKNGCQPGGINGESDT